MTNDETSSSSSFVIRASSFCIYAPLASPSTDGVVVRIARRRGRRSRRALRWRAGVSFAVAVLLGPRWIAWLRRRFREPIKSDSPEIVRLHRRQSSPRRRWAGCSSSPPRGVGRAVRRSAERLRGPGAAGGRRNDAGGHRRRPGQASQRGQRHRRPLTSSSAQLARGRRGRRAALPAAGRRGRRTAACVAAGGNCRSRLGCGSFRWRSS